MICAHVLQKLQTTLNMGDPLDDVMEGQGRTRKNEFIDDNSFGVSNVLLAQQKYQQNINKQNDEQNINKISTKV